MEIDNERNSLDENLQENEQITVPYYGIIRHCKDEGNVTYSVISGMKIDRNMKKAVGSTTE